MVHEFSRTELLIEKEGLERLRNATVMVLGVGGVGSHCIEALARSGVGTLISRGNNGNLVYQMLANFQRGVDGSKMGGEGYLRIVSFNRKTKQIHVKTYSTWNKAYHPSEHHNFTFNNVDFENYFNNTTLNK